jgi:hypothetical protein
VHHLVYYVVETSDLVKLVQYLMREGFLREKGGEEAPQEGTPRFCTGSNAVARTDHSFPAKLKNNATLKRMQSTATMSTE